MRRIQDLKPPGLSVAERFAEVVPKQRTLAEAMLDPDGVAEMIDAGMLVRDRRTVGLSPTVSLTLEGVMAVAAYSLIDPAGQ